jgi:DNA processing protein
MAVGIVGTRRASRYGQQQAERLAAGLARAGVAVVSGLARGIDAAAHRGALSAGGRTIAVLASGVLNVFPPEHKDLADQIAAAGAVVSEAAPTMPPLSGMFPQRNRIISGLALGVIIVEAADRSGALITARHAMEQGREVFAVPGPIDSPGSSGPHRLLRDGAKLVTCVDDVLEELGHLPTAAPDQRGGSIRAAAELKLNDLEHAVLQAIDPAGSMLDDVAAACGWPIHRVLATISVLESRRLVRKVGGNRVARI